MTQGTAVASDAESRGGQMIAGYSRWTDRVAGLSESVGGVPSRKKRLDKARIALNLRHSGNGHPMSTLSPIRF